MRGLCYNIVHMDCRSTAEVFLAHLKASERPALLLSLVQSLQPQDESSSHFVASLITHEEHAEARQALLCFLGSCIRRGEVQSAVSVCFAQTELGSELLGSVVSTIKSHGAADHEHLDESIVHSCLSFAKSTVSRLPIGNAHTNILHVCLVLLGNEDVRTATLAKDVIFILLSIDDDTTKQSLILPSLTAIWNTIRELVSSGQKHHPLLGYSLWLRLLLPLDSDAYGSLVNDSYWQQLRSGLRCGDTERRKLCLNILKVTVAADSSAGSNETQAQYNRYCTVFETIILGRYLNQIQECEKDLDSLASSSSVTSPWLYVLLGAALEPRMQDSNRNFIGNWIMR